MSGILCILPAIIGIPLTFYYESGSSEYEHGYPCLVIAFFLSAICLIAGRLEEATQEESEAHHKQDDG